VLRSEDLWALHLVRLEPLSVQIESLERVSRVAHDDAIRVEHGHNFNDEVLPEEVSYRVSLL